MTKYLRDNEDIVFVVFHDYYCASSADTRASRDQLERSKKTRNEDIMTPEYESIYVVSDVLREALLEVADSDPFDSSFDSEMQAPYLFVFHKRKVLQELADTGKDDIGIHVGLLLKYIYSRYGSDYEDADAKFARGVVTSDHFTKLWVPNELLIERETKGGTDRRGTYVNTDWPTNCRSFEKGYTKVLQLDVWCWEYDGMQCKREKFLYGVDLDGQAEMAIDHLLIFPRRFASDAVQEQLKARGKKYWSFRFQHLANYTGYDFQDETRYVSLRFKTSLYFPAI